MTTTEPLLHIGSEQDDVDDDDDFDVYTQQNTLANHDYHGLYDKPSNNDDDMNGTVLTHTYLCIQP